MSNLLLPSVLPVLRNLPSDFPREPLLPGLKRRPFSLFPLIFLAFLSVALIFGAIQLASLPKNTSPSATATGRVTQVERIGGDTSDAAQTTFVKYRFKVGDQLIYGNCLLSSGATIPRMGDEVSVAYAPTRARDNSLAPTLANVQNEAMIKRVALIVVPFFHCAVVCVHAFHFFCLFRRAIYWIGCARAISIARGEIVPGRVQFVRNRLVPRSPNAAASYEIVATYSVEGVLHYGDNAL